MRYLTRRDQTKTSRELIIIMRYLEVLLIFGRDAIEKTVMVFLAVRVMYPRWEIRSVQQRGLVGKLIGIS